MTTETPQILGYNNGKQLYLDSRTLVYRAIRESDAQAVVIKILREEYPTFEELARLCNQYTITRHLDIDGIIKLYKLEPYKNGYALVMEDFDGLTLAEFIHTETCSIEQFLTIAVQIAKTLQQIHTARVIHKDIKPSNILINPLNLQVKLFDFSIASLLPRETPEIQNPNILEGTLAYISPEQTGRMNRGIDFRSDFYSLGVTFYELLTGQLPFHATEPMELVHCHIAKQPIPPSEINPQVPAVLSDIVLKLMAKNAEDRYQGAIGLQYDLQRCLEQLQSTAEIATFKIGQRDLSDQFLISERLYGRESAVERLLDGWERVAQGGAELILVAGFSGIGKTAVVNEVHKPIVQKQGYFIKGKFDQLQRSIPFSAFVQAFRNLIRQLLSESDSQLEQWKSQILAVVGENAQVIIEVIPELEKLIGKQPPALELAGDAARNRFNLLFPKFVQVFTSESHPLVIFLDDLQWADSASLKLLQLLVKDTKYLLFLGAYRDNEVSPVHPLMLTVDEIRKAEVTIDTITLLPLSQSDINQLVADTLSCHTTISQPLTELVYQKTQGNPFFTTQFLKALYEDSLIQFNQDVGNWQCDISQIKLLSLTDNVVEFMAQQLQKLSPDTQVVLKLAACIGAQFDLSTLAIVAEQSEIETAVGLWKALQLGLVVPLNETYKFFQEDSTAMLLNSSMVGTLSEGQMLGVNYRFLHDRVQQAAYYLIAEQERAPVHYQIGKLLLQQASPAARVEKLFTIVNQLNYGIELIVKQSERDELAQLNLEAGLKARSSVAYQAACEYVETGLNLLGESGWQRHHDMCLNLHNLAAEITFICGDFHRMNQLIEIVIRQTKRPIERVAVYMVKMQALASQRQLLEVVNLSRIFLKELDVELPENPTLQDVQAELQQVQDLIGERNIEDLYDLPKMTNAEKIAIMQVADSAANPAYLLGSLLQPLLILLLVKTSIQYGNNDVSAYGHVAYGSILLRFSANVKIAVQFGRIGYKIANTEAAKNYRARAFVSFGSHILHRIAHVRETLPILQEAYKVGLETGQLIPTGSAAFVWCYYNYFCGYPLGEITAQIREYKQQILNLNILTYGNYVVLLWELIIFLVGNPDQIELVFERVSNLGDFSQDALYLTMFHLFRAILKFLLGDVAESLLDIARAREHMRAIFCTVVEAILYFYEALILLSTVPDSISGLSIHPLTNSESQQRIAENQTKLKQWAEYAPMNYLHKWQLVEAEKSRLLGLRAEAIDLYDQAIAGAQEHGYLQEEALANELAAKFYLDWGKEKIAAVYMQTAYYCYSRWGAKVKVQHLEQLYPQLLSPILQRHNSSLDQTFSSIEPTISSGSSHGLGHTSSSGTEVLDLATVMKASQSLAEEIELEKLLTTLMQVVCENAGAEKSVLLLLQDNDWIVAAQRNTSKTTIEKTIQNPTAQLTQRAGETLEMNAPSLNLLTSQELPRTVINYVSRTDETLVIDNVRIEADFAKDPYIISHQPQSLLCTPIHYRGTLIAILYLENSLTTGAFTQKRLEILRLLTSQAAISLQNSMLYTNLGQALAQLEDYSHSLERKVEQRTQELQDKNQRLSETLTELQHTQSHLIQTEKMSSLGQLVAGIAHEINNPISFISGNLIHVDKYTQSLLKLLALYQKHYPSPHPEIETEILTPELEFLMSDLANLLSSMSNGANRISQIVLSLRTFSRMDEAEIKAVDLHQGIESTLLLLQHRLEKTDARPAIHLIKEYTNLPHVNCYASQINQVFMNILVNAIDSLDASDKISQEINTSGDRQTKVPTIKICTKMTNNHTVTIQITDNGLGMSEEVKQRIFDPFFTTKPVGTGTGLGLAISYSIIKKHGGNISVISEIGKGAEFSIDIQLNQLKGLPTLPPAMF
jgi:predicted ATPase/signal transduction histidine kinase